MNPTSPYGTTKPKLGRGPGGADDADSRIENALMRIMWSVGSALSAAVAVPDRGETDGLAEQTGSVAAAMPAESGDATARR